MLNRRTFGTLLAGAAAWGDARAAGTTLPFYASAGPELDLYALDVGAASLAHRGSVTLPANVQYAWPHPSLKYLYVIASNGQPGSGPMGATGSDKNHYAIAYRIGPDGTLTQHGKPAVLPVRPLHASVDHEGAYLLIAYNRPSMVTVHRLRPDGSIGEEVKQTHNPDFGIYAHQVRATPLNKTVTLCSRGNDPTATKPEDPGHIEVFGFQDGQLSNLETIFPGNSGLGFGPRHLDFHPTAPFVYVSLERENALYVFGLKPDGTMTPQPLFKRSTLIDPDGKAKHPGQGAGPIHCHPNGKFVYQTNRGSGTIAGPDGKKVWNGGENSVVVWSIDQATGEPTRIQNAPAHGFELRTFTMDPAGKVLIAASTTPMLVNEGGTLSTVSAGLSIFRIGDDGKLSFARKADIDTAKGVQFWCGLLNMP
ncbi:MAG TPA: beta-propeller fold lactonase family protein [Rhizomicrobium sp.]|jgi:6-phosphogluconolactonase (cycloisomerase 2 family)|nr:beta-propeller fold lactonase family protein [Rhizomicrobium sp.]